MRFKLLSISIALLFFFAVSVVVYTSKSEKEQVRIILLTVESLRNDMITEEYCPNLLQAADSAIRLTNYRAVSGWTGSNIVSLLTGFSPFQSGVHTRGQSLDPTWNLPLTQLVDKGYAAEGIQPFMAMELYQNLGLSLSDYGGDPLIWLAEKQLADQPFFLWYHYVDTHLPYLVDAPEEAVFQSETVLDEPMKARLQKVATQPSIRFDEATFTAEDVTSVRALHGHAIKTFDTWFDTFFSFLRSGGFLRNTILIVTADHGEEHGERGMVGHASTTLEGHLHEEIVHIPFFIWLPETILSQTKVIRENALFSHLDVIPTLMDLLKIPVDASLWGRSMFDESSEEKWVAMTSSGGFSEPDPERIRYFEYALITDGWKSRLRLFSDGREESFLYHLATDPYEAMNVAADNPGIVALHRDLLSPLIEKQQVRPVLRATTLAESEGQGPVWLRPARSGTYSYDALQGVFALEWEGGANGTYIIEYKAGKGIRMLAGTLETETNRKDFGTIGRRYWNTWIVPNSPYRIRVRAADSPNWSAWLTLKAIP